MKIGVIDIGTRATRVMVGDTDTLQANGFRFGDFETRADLTAAGAGIYDEGGQVLYRFSELEKTLRFLFQALEFCDRRGVRREDVHAVGTEVFRRVANRAQLIDVIRNTTGLDVTVLHPLEEAETTFHAAMVSCRAFYEPGEPFLVIEQGGGSLQVSLASVDGRGRPARKGQTSVPELGTALLRKRFVEQGEERYVRTVQREVEAFATGRLRDHLAAQFGAAAEAPPAVAFAVGNAATDFFRPRLSSNRKVHGRAIRRDQMTGSLLSEDMVARYDRYTVGSLLKDAESGVLGQSVRDVERQLERIYGLPCYAAVLEHFGLGEMRVCGTGLRYGVFFRVAHGDWKDVRRFDGTA